MGQKKNTLAGWKAEDRRLKEKKNRKEKQVDTLKLKKGKWKEESLT